MEEICDHGCVVWSRRVPEGQLKTFEFRVKAVYTPWVNITI
jgi:hypothetical protein